MDTAFILMGAICMILGMYFHLKSTQNPSSLGERHPERIKKKAARLGPEYFSREGRQYRTISRAFFILALVGMALLMVF